MPYAVTSPLQGITVIEVASFIAGPPPWLGERTTSILEQPGYNIESIAELGRRGVIATQQEDR
jgi:crotonobetainyl-CoA:carnitine CoA-transferase CaiB-like acyl-CoA transferase